MTGSFQGKSGKSLIILNEDGDKMGLTRLEKAGAELRKLRNKLKKINKKIPKRYRGRKGDKRLIQELKKLVR